MTDLFELCTRLEHADLLVPGYIPPAVGLYAPEHFLAGRYLEDADFWILPDRNLTSRITQLAQGTVATPVHTGAALLMAFAQCLDLEFEPSISFHELAASQGNEGALQELAVFRSANAPRPQEWLNLALGRTNQMHPAPLPPLEDHNLAKPLIRWRRNYVVLLKVGALELQPELMPAQRVLQLMRWMESDFIVAGPALLFASLYFSPRFTKGGMLKQLRSKDREIALRGIRNATWDVTYLSNFVERVNQEELGPNRYLMATQDWRLRDMAKILISHSSAADVEAALERLLAPWWSQREAGMLAHATTELLSVAATRTREEDATKPVGFISGLIEEAEEQIRRITPR